MRFWLCLVLAACGADSASAPAAAPPPLPPPALPRAAPPPQTGAHGAEIAVLGVTADGRTVASADRLGGIRLWTALDGTREPVVIRGTAAKAITVARDGSGFVIGTLDAAGGVQLIRTTAIGAVQSRTPVAGPQPATEIASTAEGLLILRADQTIELVDPAGVQRSRLIPEPGNHIDSLVVRGDHVLALMLEDKQLHGRWIVIDHGARWGEATPNLPFRPSRAVLSPTGELLAATRARGLHPALIDLATGKPRKTALCVAKDWPHEDGDDSAQDAEIQRNNNAPVPLAFLSEDVVACSVMTALMWWNTSGTQHPNIAGSFAVATLPVAVADRALVIGSGPSLALVTPNANRFVGYGVHNLSGMHAAAGGILVSSDSQSIMLDASFGERARFEANRGRSEWQDVIAIDDRYAVASMMRRSVERREVGSQVAVFDGVARAVHQLLPFAARDKELIYEPSTRLLATTDGAMSVLVRFDPVSHTFGEPIVVGAGVSPNKLVVLDPRLSGGVAALEIDNADDGLLIGELREADLRPGTTVQPRTTYRVPGELRAVDRAGHLYVHAADDHDDVVVYTRGVAGARLSAVAGLVLKPSADGSRIAAFASPRLVLLTATGQVRWDSAQWSGGDVDWTSTGDLVVQFPSGIARIDLETGAMAERRCGWGFGVSDQQLDGGSGASICDAER
jgi:hypothetical protein